MPRGRKEGSSSGKRSIFWVCISCKDRLIVEKIYSPNSASEDEIRSFTADKASKAYHDLHGIDPEEIIGPCYDVKSLGKEDKNIKINKFKNTINPNTTNISSFLGFGTYSGWKGSVFNIVGKNEEVLFIASERVDSNINKALPSTSPIKKDLIIFHAV
jgi:hypothetical protein